jgi:hypothetical protein
VEETNLLVLSSLASQTLRLRYTSFAISTLFFLSLFLFPTLLVLLCLPLRGLPITLFLSLKLLFEIANLFFSFREIALGTVEGILISGYLPSLAVGLTLIALPLGVRSSLPAPLFKLT